MDQPLRPSRNTLFSNVDPHPVRVLNQESTLPILLVCDHASNYVPRDLNNLGLSDADLARHIGWDRGSGEVTERIAKALGYRALLCNYSRLVIDCNRREHDPSLILDISDGTPVPGNLNLTHEQRRDRMEQIYVPYHEAVSSAIDDLQLVTPAPAVIAIHSFTPQLHDAEPRPWHVGILWDTDARLADPLLNFFNKQADLCVGDNQPYSGKHLADYTIDHHGESRGLPCVSLELRQDLLDAEGGIERWADYLVEVLKLMQDETAIFAQTAPTNK